MDPQLLAEAHAVLNSTIPPSRRPKTTTKKPSSTSNVAKAREARRQQLEALHAEKVKQNDRKKQKLSLLDILAESSEEEEDDSEEETIVYKPKVRTTGRGKTSKSHEDQLRQEIEELKKTMANLNVNKQLPPTPEPPKKSQNDMLVETMRHRILNF